MEEKGITIVFKGDTVEFDKDLTGVNKALKVLKSEMSNINKQLKLDPKNIDLLKSKFDNLQQQQKTLKTSIELYQEELSKLSKEDIGGDKWIALNKELGKAQVNLQLLDKRLEEMPSEKAINLTKTFADMEKKLSSIGKTLESVGKKLSVLSGVVAGLGVAGVKYNAQLEQYQVALTTLLGTEEEATKVMEQIQEDASKTPFDVDSLTKANSLLISAGVSADESREVIIALGDAIAATGGGSNELSRMAQNLQQIKNVGKATAQDIKQFANSGINIYGLLADYTGKTTEEIKDMDISFEVLSEALKSASQEGGKYFGAMKKQSQTLNGLISTLKDTISQLLGELTQSLVPVIKRVIGYVNSAIETIRGLSVEQKQMITNIGLFIVALGPVVLAVGKLMTIGSQISGTIAKLIPMIDKMKGGIGGLASPAAIILGTLAVLYATNEQFRESINSLIGTLTDSLKPILETLSAILTQYIIPLLNSLLGAILPVLTTVLETVFGVISKIVEWIGKLWAYLEDRGVIDLFIKSFENVAFVINTVVEGVKALFGWFGSLIDKAKEFLGIGGQVQQSASAITDGRGIAVNYGSGGFASGGITLNNTINVSNNGANITQAQVLSWADIMTQRINDNLGRMV